jgi:hypothetical protein
MIVSVFTVFSNIFIEVCFSSKKLCYAAQRFAFAKHGAGAGGGFI